MMRQPINILQRFEDRIVIIGVWLVGSSSFVVPLHLSQFDDAWIIPRESVNMDVARAVGWFSVMLGIPVFFFFHRWMSKHRPVGILTAIPALATWVLIGAHIAVVGLPSLRVAVTLTLFGVCIGTWFTLLFFERLPTQPDILKLIHTRYLEYLKQFLWLMAIVIISYLAWEIQAPSGDSGISSRENTWTVSFAQLLFTTGFGIGLVILAFHRRLNEIESKLAEQLRRRNSRVTHW